MMATPNYVTIGSSEQKLLSMTSEVCDTCTGRVWLNEKGSCILSEADLYGHPSTVLCVRCALREYGTKLVTQILLDQNEGDY